MSIASEITALGTNLAAAKDAVTAKGGTVGNTGLAGLATEISGIPAGGGSSTPVVPPSPDGVYVQFSALTPDFVLDKCESCDPTTVIVDFSRTEDLFGLLSNTSPDFALDSVFCESPNTGEAYNMVFRWNSSMNCFEVVFKDSSDQENVITEIQEFELADYGIYLSDTSFMYDGNDVDLAYLRYIDRITPYYSDITIYDSTEFANFMTPVTGNWDETNIGEGFPGLMRINENLVQKQFITDINFGTLAEGLTTIQNGFGGGYTHLRTMYNLPSTITTIGTNFLADCQHFNSYFEIPSGVTIGSGFLSGCHAFNQPFTIPANTTLDTSSSYSFMFNCYSMVSTVDIETSATAIGQTNNIFSSSVNTAQCYLTGISLSGQYGKDWSNKLGNRASTPFRKLLPSISVTPATTEVGVGFTTNLSVSYFPDSQVKGGTWSSSDPTVVTVDQNGVVTGVSAGTATITFQTTTGFSASSTVASVVYVGKVKLSDNTIVPIKNTSAINSLCRSGTSWTATISGVTFNNLQVVGVSITSTNVTTLGDYFLNKCTNLAELELPTSITRVGSYFLSYCSSFNQGLSLPNLATIGQGFMSHCASFNQPLSLPSMTSVAPDFLSNCDSFDQDFVIPSTFTMTLWANFIANCGNMTGTITCNAAYAGSENSSILSTSRNTDRAYTVGITLAGPYASSWKTALPDSDVQPYRKLILAS